MICVSTSRVKDAYDDSATSQLKSVRILCVKCADCLETPLKRMNPGSSVTKPRGMTQRNFTRNEKVNVWPFLVRGFEISK